MGLLTRDGLRVLVKQISGVVARRIVCEARLGQELPRGARYGMIKFGSRTEVYLPVWASYRVVAKTGQRVRGGETAVVEPAGAEHRV
jgi:phosphatidylserine decarboxylase